LKSAFGEGKGSDECAIYQPLQQSDRIGLVEPGGHASASNQLN